MKIEKSKIQDLIGLMSMTSAAKDAYKEASKKVAKDHSIKVSALNKCVSALVKSTAEDLRQEADQIVELLDL